MTLLYGISTILSDYFKTFTAQGNILKRFETIKAIEDYCFPLDSLIARLKAD